MGIFSKIITAIRGGATEVGEAIVDSQAMRILDQEIRDAGEDLRLAKDELTKLMAKRKLADEDVRTLGSKVGEYEGYLGQVLAREAPEAALESLRQEQWISHHEAGLWLAERLGQRVENPNRVAGEHFVQGKQLFGDNLIQRVTETPDGLRYDKPYLLSRWLDDLNRQGHRAGAEPLCTADAAC